MRNFKGIPTMPIRNPIHTPLAHHEIRIIRERAWVGLSIKIYPPVREVIPDFPDLTGRLVFKNELHTQTPEVFGYKAIIFPFIFHNLTLAHLVLRRIDLTSIVPVVCCALDLPHQHCARGKSQIHFLQLFYRSQGFFQSKEVIQTVSPWQVSTHSLPQ